MSKNLSPSELNVLQENFDLFTGAAPAAESASQTPDTAVQTAHKARRPLLQRDKTTKAEAQTRTTSGGQPQPADAPKRPRSNKRRNAAAESRTTKPQSDMAETAKKEPSQPDAHKPEPYKAEPRKTEASITNDTPSTEPARAAPAALASSSDYSATGRQILGVRSTSALQAREWLSAQGVTIENYAIEKRDPALRNLAEALLERGVEFRSEGRALEWFLISSEQPSSELLQLPAVEVAFSVAWFDEQKAHIRRLKGGDYIDACGVIAGRLPLSQALAAESLAHEPS